MIREMRDEDLDAVAGLVGANFDGVLARHHSPAVLAWLREGVTRAALREQRGWKRFFVVEERGRPVAVGALADCGPAGAARLCVSQFYVEPERQGTGIGARLLAHLVTLARERRAGTLHVPSSRNAIGFYRTAGFTVDAAQPDAEREITWMTRPL